jgi:hypothetical protein
MRLPVISLGGTGGDLRSILGGWYLNGLWFYLGISSTDPRNPLLPSAGLAPTFSCKAPSLFAFKCLRSEFSSSLWQALGDLLQLANKHSLLPNIHCPLPPPSYMAIMVKNMQITLKNSLPANGHLKKCNKLTPQCNLGPMTIHHAHSIKIQQNRCCRAPIVPC